MEAWDETPRTRSMLKDVFGRIDTNHSGGISRAELIKALRVDTQVRAMLQLPARITEDERCQFEDVFRAIRPASCILNPWLCLVLCLLWGVMILCKPLQVIARFVPKTNESA